jgi:2-polyprenyl-3-methyl-5-hydroxy-6-metoxy-1,4-benzoquinol methylase
MIIDSYTRQRNYYEDYWKFRVEKGRIHTLPNIWTPQRIRIAVKMVIEKMNAAADRKVKILDIGCGEGALGKLLLDTCKDGISLYGCDISETAKEIACQFYSRVYRLDVETEKFPADLRSKKFDILVALDILEHLFRPKIVLKKMYDMLRKEGCLITSFPNIAWYKYRMELLRGHFPEDYLFSSGDHLQQFTLHSFTRLLQRSGFNLVSLDGQFIIPSFLRPARIFLPILKKLPNLFGYQIVIKARKSRNTVETER